MYISVYIYIYVYRERERERDIYMYICLLQRVGNDGLQLVQLGAIGGHYDLGATRKCSDLSLSIYIYRERYI